MTNPSDMTDRELLECVAREVLKEEPSRSGENVVYLPTPADRLYVRTLHLDWKGIGKVVEALRDRFDLLIKPTVAECSIYPKERTGRSWSAHAEDPARAVFEAALKAVREGDDG